MRYFGLRTPLELALAVALAGSVGIILHEYRQLADSRRSVEENHKSIQALEASLRACRQQGQAAVEVPLPVTIDGAALAQRNTTIHELNRELSEAHIAAHGLQVQLANARDEREKTLQAADEKLRKQQADFESQLRDLQQKSDATETEVQATRERNIALEADNAKLRNDVGEGAARAAEFARLAASLEDINRRRDTYLTSLVRRYRDATSQLRGISGMMDASHEQTASACSTEALIRMQNVVAQADDDLRQLNDLNAQARQIEKKLAKK